MPNTDAQDRTVAALACHPCVGSITSRPVIAQFGPQRSTGSAHIIISDIAGHPIAAGRILVDGSWSLVGDPL